LHGNEDSQKVSLLNEHKGGANTLAIKAHLGTSGDLYLVHFSPSGTPEARSTSYGEYRQREHWPLLIF